MAWSRLSLVLCVRWAYLASGRRGRRGAPPGEGEVCLRQRVEARACTNLLCFCLHKRREAKRSNLVGTVQQRQRLTRAREDG